MRSCAVGLFRRGPVALVLALACGGVTPARAEWSAQSLAPVLEKLSDGGQRFLAASQGMPSSRSLRWLVTTESAERAREAGYFPITETLAVAYLPLEAVCSQTLVQAAVPASLRFPLMDIATREVRAVEAVDDWGLQGSGTIVGIVDTGGDPSHPALQNADGTTRIAWLLSFDQKPRGVHAELEELYGCNSEDEPCAVYSKQDIDALLSDGRQAEFPQDRIGHGTHLASLAAGRDDEFPGIAPQADLIIVAAASADGAVSDSRILLGTKFVFDRASDSKQAAVVNVSLGSSFGAHDGSSSLEKGLTELASGKGRAVIIASGNSGSLLSFENANYPGPFGVHTEVSVPETEPVSVPLLHSASGSATTFGSIFVWIKSYEDQSLSLAFRNDQGKQTTFVAPGDSGALSSSDLGDPDDYDVVLLNGVDDLDAGVEPGSMVFALAGSWKSGRSFELLLKGRGTARIWATGPRGDFSTLLPRARVEGTVAIPGSGPELITVGATVNRTAWVDWEGDLVGSSTHDVGLASFTALGPNQLGNLKPELLAPGSGVIGAMAAAADPRDGGSRVSQFASSGMCPENTECFVIDDEHGIAMGTSMAAPIVAGAAALLFERQPELTMQGVKRLLMAGANLIPSPENIHGLGTGQLDIVRSLLAQDAAMNASSDPSRGSDSENTPQVNPQKSYLTWADEFVHPSPGPALSGYLTLRDLDGNPVVVDPKDFEVTVDGPGRAEATVVSAGLARINLIADGGTGTNQLSVTALVRGEVVETSTVPIALDPQLAAGLYEFSGGSCSWSGSRRSAAPTSMLLLLSAVALVRFLGARWKRALS